MLVPKIIYAIKQRKITGLIAAISMYRPNAAEAAPINITQAQTLTVMDIPKNPGAKLICQDPWVSVLMTAITVIGVIVYLYRSCHHKTLTRGYKFASICELYVILCNSTRYVPLKIGKCVGSPFLFTYAHTIPKSKVQLQKQLLWDHVHLHWSNENIRYKDSPIPLKEHVTTKIGEK